MSSPNGRISTPPSPSPFAINARSGHLVSSNPCHSPTSTPDSLHSSTLAKTSPSITSNDISLALGHNLFLPSIAPPIMPHHFGSIDSWLAAASSMHAAAAAASFNTSSSHSPATFPGMFSRPVYSGYPNYLPLPHVPCKPPDMNDQEKIATEQVPIGQNGTSNWCQGTIDQSVNSVVPSPSPKATAKTVKCGGRSSPSTSPLNLSLSSDMQDNMLQSEQLEKIQMADTNVSRSVESDHCSDNCSQECSSQQELDNM